MTAIADHPVPAAPAPPTEGPAGPAKLTDLRLSPHPRRRIFLLVFFLLLEAIACGSLLLIDGEVEGPGILRFDSAFKSTPVADDGTSTAMSVSLPHHCEAKTSRRGCAATFEIRYLHDEDGNPPVSIYIPHFVGDLNILLNGNLIGQSHWSQSSFHLGQRAPLLVPLLAPALKPGENRIGLFLDSRLAVGGFLGPVYIGPDDLLRSSHDLTQFLIVTLPRMFDGWLISVSLLMLLIWVMRPWDHLYLVIGVMLLSYAITSLPAVFVNEPSEALLRFTNSSRTIAGALVLPLVWLFLGRRPPVPVWVFLLIPATVYVGTLFLPGNWLAWLVGDVVSPILVLLTATAAAVLVRAAIRERSDATILLLGVVLATALLGARDLLILSDVIEEDPILLTRYAAVFVSIVLSSLLLWRFAAALRLQEEFSARLQHAVAVAENGLRQSFAREQAQMRRAALEAERVRLMSDLHDGIAGQLVSILSLCELRKDASNDEIARASRRALEDLRLVVSSLEDVGDDLALMLAMFRERIEPQLRAAGLRLVWRVTDPPALPGLNPTVMLTIFRILQEASTNAARHSGSPTVEIVVERSLLPGRGARLVVRDAGHGGAAERPGGIGMTSMRRRAAAIGAALSVESGPQGTSVVLDLPEAVDRAVRTGSAAAE